MKEAFAPYTQPINRLATNKGLRPLHSDYPLDPTINANKSSFASYNNTSSTPSLSSPASSVVVDAEADRYRPNLPIYSNRPSDRNSSSYPPHAQRPFSSAAYKSGPSGTVDTTSPAQEEEGEVDWSEMELKAINDDIGKVKVIFMT